MPFGSKKYDYVCGKCFNDDALEAFVDGNAVSKECDFCGRKSRKKIAAHFEEVSERIAECIGRYYDDPGNAGMLHDSSEGGYQGITYDTFDVFELMELDFPRDGGDELRNELASAMPNDLWCESEPYRLNPDDKLQYSWDSFCEIIKHKLRYFFTETVRGEDDEIYGPSQLLKLIFAYAKSSDAFITLPSGTTVYRARPEAPGEKFMLPSELGPPPVDAAIKANRMSPPGIVMTYVADDP